MSAVPALGSGRRRGAITRKHRKVFLERLAAGFSVAASAEPTGKGRQRFYEERAADSDFAEAWRHAWEAGQDVIEDELLRAATEGWIEVEEVFEKGELVRRVERQRKNPALLAKLERKRQPETSPLVEVNVRQIEGYKPPTTMDLVRYMVANYTPEQVVQFWGEPYGLDLRTVRAIAGAQDAEADVVDVEAVEVEGRTSSQESRSHVASAFPPGPPAVATNTPDTGGREPISESHLDRSTDPGATP